MLSLSARLSILFLLLFATGPAFGQERTYEAPACKSKNGSVVQLPVAITDVRNLQNEHWLRDLEIEVRNVSNRPVYYVALFLEFPRISAPPPTRRVDGSIPASSRTGFRLIYGNPQLIDVRNLAGPQDIPLRPGETHVFRVPEARVSGLEHMREWMNLTPEATGHIVIRYDTTSFGDGEGYVGGCMHRRYAR